MGPGLPAPNTRGWGWGRLTSRDKGPINMSVYLKCSVFTWRAQRLQDCCHVCLYDNYSGIKANLRRRQWWGDRQGSERNLDQPHRGEEQIYRMVHTLLQKPCLMPLIYGADYSHPVETQAHGTISLWIFVFYLHFASVCVFVFVCCVCVFSCPMSPGN